MRKTKSSIYSARLDALIMCKNVSISICVQCCMHCPTKEETIVYMVMRSNIVVIFITYMVSLVIKDCRANISIINGRFGQFSKQSKILNILITFLGTCVSNCNIYFLYINNIFLSFRNHINNKTNFEETRSNKVPFC